jgi:hypothetical protein
MPAISSCRSSSNSSGSLHERVTKTCHSLVPTPDLRQNRITVVLPLFLFLVAVAHNPSVSGNVISYIFGAIIFAIFLIGAIFEIKRLADNP